MKFLKRTEINTYIKANVLDGITENNDLLLDDIEAIAISEIDSYIGGKYNTITIFDKKGNNRNAYIISLVIDIMLFHLYSRIAPDNIPEIRLQRYAKGIEWLENVAKGKVSPNLPILDKTYDNRSSEILYGSFPKINNESL